MEPVKNLTPKAFTRTEKAVVKVEGMSLPPRTTDPGREFNRPFIRAILLDDLDNDDVVDAAVTELVETTEIQQVSLEGEASGGTFRLSFRDQETAPIPWNATATELQEALEHLETIGQGNVAVALGKTSAHNPGVWLVTFTGSLGGIDVPLLDPTDNLTGIALVVAATTLWADTGRVEQVRAVIPVGVPTPMRAGAVVVAAPFLLSGYGVIGCECRDFEPGLAS